MPIPPPLTAPLLTSDAGTKSGGQHSIEQWDLGRQIETLREEAREAVDESRRARLYCHQVRQEVHDFIASEQEYSQQDGQVFGGIASLLSNTSTLVEKFGVFEQYLREKMASELEQRDKQLRIDAQGIVDDAVKGLRGDIRATLISFKEEIVTLRRSQETLQHTLQQQQLELTTALQNAIRKASSDGEQRLAAVDTKATESVASLRKFVTSSLADMRQTHEESMRGTRDASANAVKDVNRSLLDALASARSDTTAWSDVVKRELDAKGSAIAALQAELHNGLREFREEQRRVVESLEQKLSKERVDELQQSVAPLREATGKLRHDLGSLYDAIVSAFGKSAATVGGTDHADVAAATLLRLAAPQKELDVLLESHLASLQQSILRSHDAVHEKSVAQVERLRAEVTQLRSSLSERVQTILVESAMSSETHHREQQELRRRARLHSLRSAAIMFSLQSQRGTRSIVLHTWRRWVALRATEKQRNREERLRKALVILQATTTRRTGVVLRRRAFQSWKAFLVRRRDLRRKLRLVTDVRNDASRSLTSRYLARWIRLVVAIRRPQRRVAKLRSNTSHRLLQCRFLAWLRFYRLRARKVRARRQADLLSLVGWMASASSSHVGLSFPYRVATEPAGVTDPHASMLSLATNTTTASGGRAAQHSFSVPRPGGGGLHDDVSSWTHAAEARWSPTRTSRLPTASSIRTWSTHNVRLAREVFGLWQSSAVARIRRTLHDRVVASDCIAESVRVEVTRLRTQFHDVADTQREFQQLVVSMLTSKGDAARLDLPNLPPLTGLLATIEQLREGRLSVHAVFLALAAWVEHSDRTQRAFQQHLKSLQSEVTSVQAWMSAIDDEIRRVQKFVRPPFKA